MTFARIYSLFINAFNSPVTPRSCITHSRRNVNHYISSAAWTNNDNVGSDNNNNNNGDRRNHDSSLAYYVRIARRAEFAPDGAKKQDRYCTLRTRYHNHDAELIKTVLMLFINI